MAAVTLLDPAAGAVVVVLTVVEAGAVVRGLELAEMEARGRGAHPFGLGELAARVGAAMTVARDRALQVAAGNVRDDPDRMLSTEQVADRLGVSPRWVRQLLAAGDLPGARVGRCWRVRAGDLTACGSVRK
ncbi:MAG: DNA-binding protein [Jatrophihabitans sp.]|nr:MAG: DNA-binding protein [Jatrophihabitans sp.]